MRRHDNNHPIRVYPPASFGTLFAFDASAQCAAESELIAPKVVESRPGENDSPLNLIHIRSTPIYVTSLSLVIGYVAIIRMRQSSEGTFQSAKSEGRR